MDEINKKIAVHSIIILLVLLISQSIIVYLVFDKFDESVNLSLDKINKTESNINYKIDQNKLETQSQIKGLTDAISDISSVQTDLKEQLSKVKADTSADFSGIIEEDIKGVVTIKTDVSQGTGFIIREDGYVVTNAHVLADASMSNVQTSDNKIYHATLVGYSPQNELDIALLKISGTFDKIGMGNSDDVKVGEKVVAIGNPLGLSFSVTEGIISARDRKGVNNLPYYFQTDASLNPGNSGGPLINTGGEVIGINNFKVSGADNIGFALEINRAIEEINYIAMQSLNETIL